MSWKKGQTLIGAVFVVVVIALLAIVAASLLSGESFSSAKNYQGIQALNIAEGGIRFTIATSLAADSDWTNNADFGPINFFSGTFYVHYVEKTVRTCQVEVTGTVNGITRVVRARLKRSGLPDAFDYGIYCNNLKSQTLYVQNNATIYGDFYYDGPVVMQNSARLLNGTLYSDSLSLQNGATAASWEPISNPVPPPDFDSSYYDNLLLQTGHSAAGPLNLANGATLNLAGQTLYYTSISISNNAQVIGPGTLVATTGNFNLTNSASIGNDVTVIVSGTSTLGNSASVGSDFNLISQGSISNVNNQNIPPEAVFFSYGNVSFSNSSQFWGSVLAPSGEVSSGNATTFNGLLYAKKLSLSNSSRLNGSAAVNEIGYFTNSVIVTYDPSKFPTVTPQGLGGSAGSAEVVGISEWAEYY